MRGGHGPHHSYAQSLSTKDSAARPFILLAPVDVSDGLGKLPVFVIRMGVVATNSCVVVVTQV